MADPKPDPQGHSCAEVAVVVCAPGGLAVTGGDEQFLPLGVYHSSCVVLRLKCGQGECVMEDAGNTVRSIQIGRGVRWAGTSQQNSGRVLPDILLEVESRKRLNALQK